MPRSRRASQAERGRRKAVPDHPETGQSSAEYAVAALVTIAVVVCAYGMWAQVGPPSGTTGPSATVLKAAPYTLPTATNARQQWLLDLAVH